MRHQRQGSLARQPGRDNNSQPNNLAVAEDLVQSADSVVGREERKQGIVENRQQEEDRLGGNSGSRAGRRVVEGQRVSSGTCMLARS